MRRRGIRRIRKRQIRIMRRSRGRRIIIILIRRRRRRKIIRRIRRRSRIIRKCNKDGK